MCICQPLFPGESAVDQLVEIIKVLHDVVQATFFFFATGISCVNLILWQVLGTPTREEIRCMNPNYTEFKFPQIKAHPWHKVAMFSYIGSPSSYHFTCRAL